MKALLTNEIDSGMKELYENEIESIKLEISHYDDQLIDSFFQFRNKDIEEVLVEIRAGNMKQDKAFINS